MNADVWTPTVMIERLSGDEILARELVALFLEEYPALIASLRDRVAGGDPEQVRLAAHALKGCVANFIDQGPRATAFEIERMGASGSLAGVGAALSRLEREIGEMVAQMREFEGQTSCES